MREQRFQRPGMTFLSVIKCKIMVGGDPYDHMTRLRCCTSQNSIEYFGGQGVNRLCVHKTTAPREALPTYISN